MNRWHHSDIPPLLPQLLNSPTTSNNNNNNNNNSLNNTAPLKLHINTHHLNCDESQKAKRVIFEHTQPTATTTATPVNHPKNTNTKNQKTITTGARVDQDNRKTEGEAASSLPDVMTGERAWQTVFIDRNYLDTIHVELTSKTRCEEPCSEVPSKMYSSLKYEIRHRASGALCDQVAFLLARITVVDSVNYEEIRKDNRPVLKGVVESALTKPPGDTKCAKQLYGVLKCQFTDVSYHHKKRDFCWQIGLFRPDDLQSPIMIMRSAPYKVFARKPATNKKRKREQQGVLEDDVTSLPADVVNPNGNNGSSSNDSSNSNNVKTSNNVHTNNDNYDGWEQFQGRLDDLFRDAKKMKMDDKKRVVSLLCEKMMAFDGSGFSQTVAHLQQQLSVIDEPLD